MTLYKVVNGVSIEMTPEEEQVILDDWERGYAERVIEKENQKLKETKIEELKIKISKSLGITLEDLNEVLK